MIVTIDGPAGAGKSSVARRLAQRLGYCFLDTGAMYRAIALAAMRRGLDWQDQSAVARLVSQVDLSIAGDRILLDREDISEEIRTHEVTACTRYVADNPPARARLVELQRQLASGKNIVTEGRDQGTVAFPEAQCKFFLTASSRRRAERRLRELRAKGDAVTLEQLLEQQNRRDAEDRAREVGQLVPAEDAMMVDTDQLELEQVVDHLQQLVERRCASRGKNVG